MPAAPACALLEKSVNRRVSERFPKDENDSGNHRTERSYAFDKTHKVDRYVDGRGVETTFGRDGVGRVTGKTFTVPDGHPEIPAVSDVNYSYDANGNWTGVSNNDGSAAWAFDNLDRLQTEQVANGPQISYVYDPRGIITDENVSSYSRLSKTHNHDAVGRRTSTIQDGQTTHFTWDNAGRRKTVTLPNGVVTTYTPDDADRLENIEYKLGGTVFENYAYELDEVGNPEKITTMNGVYEYQYDTAYRLTDESRTGFRSYVAHHEYDSLGNRTSRTIDNVTRTFTYNKADQLTGWTEGTKTGELTYDLDGNNIRKTAKNNGTLTDQWDNEFDSVGRMLISTQTVGGSQSMTNVYAGDQWYRVEESSNGTTKRFGWRRDELYAEFDGSGNLTAGYLNNGVDQPLYKTRFSSNGTVVEGRDFYHQDQNLRVHHVTNGNCQIAEKYVYNGYGKRTILDAQNNEITATAIGNRIGFQGREHEDLAGDAQEDGLTFHRNRFYSPGVGRWERRDPIGIGYEGNNGLYAFSNGNPMYYVDTLGLWPEACRCWAMAVQLKYGQDHFTDGKATKQTEFRDFSINRPSIQDDHFIPFDENKDPKASASSTSMINWNPGASPYVPSSIEGRPLRMVMAWAVRLDKYKKDDKTECDCGTSQGEEVYIHIDGGDPLLGGAMDGTPYSVANEHSTKGRHAGHPFYAERTVKSVTPGGGGNLVFRKVTNAREHGGEITIRLTVKKVGIGRPDARDIHTNVGTVNCEQIMFKIRPGDEKVWPAKTGYEKDVSLPATKGPHDPGYAKRPGDEKPFTNASF